jgi:hypothetical protein
MDRKRLWLFLVVVGLVSGCAVGRTQVVKAPETRLGNYQFVELATGKVLAESNFEGEIKGGPFGGGMDESYAKIADEIVQFLQTNL